VKAFINGAVTIMRVIIITMHRKEIRREQRPGKDARRVAALGVIESNSVAARREAPYRRRFDMLITAFAWP
jgi:hypothetical protein